MTFIPRFGSVLNLHVHLHCVVLEGVDLDRTAAGLKPRFLKGEPPSDADIAAVLQKIRRRVIRKRRHRGYLEAGSTDAVATGYDPLRSEAPELACTLAASVTQRIAFGEWTGQHVHRIGSGFGYEGERPARTGPRCASVHGFSLHAITQVEVIRKMLRHLKLTADPPPIAPARARQATFDWVAYAYAVVRRLVGDVRAAEVSLIPLSV